MNLFPGLTRKDQPAEINEADERARRIAAAPKHGPRPMKVMTNGQVRRMMTRSKASERRKASKRNRTQWMNNRLAVAVLRGQLEALDRDRAALAALGLDILGEHSTNVDPIVRDLEMKFGSVDKAYDRYAAIVAEQAA